jgi:hypothetical protein
MILVRPYRAGDAADLAPRAQEAQATTLGRRRVVELRARRSLEAWTVEQNGVCVACGGVTPRGGLWGLFATLDATAAYFATRLAVRVIRRHAHRTLFAMAAADHLRAIRLLGFLGLRPVHKIASGGAPYWVYVRGGG